MKCRRILTCSIALVCVLSCENYEPGNHVRRNQTVKDTSGVIQTVVEEEIEKTPHLYVSGVRYADGYDWRRDADYGRCECTLFLLKDGNLEVELPAGEEYMLSSDEDMHYVSLGHLYSDYPIGDETVFRQDGEEIYRSSGKEITRDVLSKGSSLYVLSEPRDSGIVFLRKDGNLVFSAPGSITSDLYEDMGDVCFSYRASSGADFLVAEGRAAEIKKPSGYYSIPILFRSYRRIYALCKRDSKHSLHIDGSFEYSIEAKPYNSFRDHYSGVKKMWQKDGLSFLLTDVRQTDSTSTSRIYREGTLDMVYEGLTYFSLLPFSKTEFLFVGYDGREKTYVIDCKGERIALPSGVRPHSRRAVDLYDGIARVALDTPEGPEIWSSDGKTTKFSFNGYIDEIVTE